MAKKRMFSTDIVDTDAFLNMSAGARLLYFFLGTHGDDDGFIGSPQMMLRASGCVEADLEMLVSRGFVIRFDSGVIALRDWRINNDLKNDRYHGTLYSEEKSALSLDEHKRYILTAEAEKACIRTVSILDTEQSIAQQSPAQQSEAKQSTAEQKNGGKAPFPCPAPDAADAKSDAVNAAKPPRPRFIPPKLEEVTDYCRERNNGIDPQQFMDFYLANGWTQGKGKPIRDWKAAVRTWEGRERHGRHDHGAGRNDTPIAGITRF